MVIPPVAHSSGRWFGDHRLPQAAQGREKRLVAIDESPCDVDRSDH